MREIKFRAWDSTKGRFAIENDELAVTFNGDIIHNGGGVSSRNDLQIMQYAGLKDKNGVDIYEGDIVKNMHGVAPVKFEGGAFCVQWDSSALNKVMYYWDDNDFEGEVIGNIYENPELLEATK